MNEELTAENDRRNVVDAFRGMSVENIKAQLDKTRHGLHIAIENIERDFNAGTIVRNANAFNIEAVHIIGKRQWNKRGAMATDLYMNVYHHPTIADFKRLYKIEISLVSIIFQVVCRCMTSSFPKMPC